MNEAMSEATEPDEHIQAEIARMMAEMQRLHEQIERDHALGQQIQARTDAKMVSIREGLEKIRTARRNYVATSF